MPGPEELKIYRLLFHSSKLNTILINIIGNNDRKKAQVLIRCDHLYSHTQAYSDRKAYQHLERIEDVKQRLRIIERHGKLDQHAGGYAYGQQDHHYIYQSQVFGKEEDGIIDGGGTDQLIHLLLTLAPDDRTRKRKPPGSG